MQLLHKFRKKIHTIMHAKSSYFSIIIWLWQTFIRAVPISVGDFITADTGGWSNSWRWWCFCASITNSNWCSLLVGSCQLHITTPCLRSILPHHLQHSRQKYRWIIDHSLTHSLTSRPSSMRVGDSRRPLRYLSSPLCPILWRIL